MEQSRYILLLCLFCFFFPFAYSKVYVSWGWHGGYYLTDEEGTHSAFDVLFQYLQANPNLKAVLELEPYTIERMLTGEKFSLEKLGRKEPQILGWNVGGSGEWKFAIGSEFAHTGSVGVRLTFGKGEYANICQQKSALELRGKTLIFSGWIRAHSGNGAHLYIDAWDASAFIPGSSRFSQRVPPDGNWHYVELEFPVPSNAVTIFPQAKIDSEPSVADFDDLSLKIKGTNEELLSNADLERTCVPSLKDEERLKKLRDFVRKGQIEIVGGAYTQPIMYTIGDEAVIRQFLLGCRAVEETLGVPVKIYSAQEPDMIGQLPQILKKFGYDAVLYRTSWGAFGFVPTHDAEVVNWIAPDGTGIIAIPQPQPLKDGWGAPAFPNSRLVEECKRRGIENPLFIAFGDFTADWVNSSAPSFITRQFERGYANICQRLPAENMRGKRLELSAWVRARKGRVHLYIDAHNAQGIAKGGVQTEDCPIDNQWHFLKLSFIVPDDAIYIFPQGRIISFDEGDADFDEISLKDAEGKELLSSGSFETDEIPREWGIGRDVGVEASGEIVKGDAKEGERYIRLRMRIPSPLYETEIVTLEEYLKAIGKPREEWVDAYEGFEHRFPFGLLAGRPQRADREGEDSILKTERLLSLAFAEQGREFPEGSANKLDDAWRLLLIGHHHDAWVCAPVIFGIWAKGFKSYAELTYSASQEAKEICQSLLNPLINHDWRRFNILNLSGIEREEIVNLKISLPSGVVRNPSFQAGGKPLPANIEILSRHPDGSVKEFNSQILVKIPPMGYISVDLKDGKTVKIEKKARAYMDDGKGVLENDFLRVSISKEGLMVYSPSGEALLRQPAYITGHLARGDEIGIIEEVRAYEKGALARGEALGKIGGVPFKLTLTLSPLSPLLKVNLHFDFGERSVIGATGEFPPMANVPDWARDDLKLRLVIPLKFKNPKFYSHGAFELREPYAKFFPILRYAGGEENGKGVAIYTDRATSGIFDVENSSLSVVLAYGGNFIYAPGGFAPLNGDEEYELALYFYEGNRESALVAQLAEEVAQPLIGLPASKVFKKTNYSLLEIKPQNAVVLSALYPYKKGFILRIWRPYEDGREVEIKFKGGGEIWLCDMMGKQLKKIGDEGRAMLTIRQNEVITIFIKGK
ncbi:hypothetical protein H5T87_10020 [bacterium]|nr:hypothetical protein [bacterium]